MTCQHEASQQGLRESARHSSASRLESSERTGCAEREDCGSEGAKGTTWYNHHAEASRWRLLRCCSSCLGEKGPANACAYSSKANGRLEGRGTEGNRWLWLEHWRQGCSRHGSCWGGRSGRCRRCFDRRARP